MRALIPTCLAGLLALAATASAQTPRVLVGDVPCIPDGGNAVVPAAAAPVPAGAEVRVYFRRQGYGDFYWVPAQPQDGTAGAYSGVLPIPEPDNDLAEVYAAVYGANGLPLAQSRVKPVPVKADCRVELDTEQQALAAHMLVGETALGQMYRKLAWWKCEGVSERQNVRGERRDDEACAPVPVWWQRPALLVPFVVAGGGVVTAVVIDDEPPVDVSPSQP